MKIYIIKSLVIILSITIFWACSDSDTTQPSIYGDIEVTVVDESQKPLADAEIALAVVGEDYILKKRSDVAGNVFYPEVLGGINLVLYTTDPLYMSEMVNVTSTAESTVKATIILGPNIIGALELQVIDGDQQVISNMEVTIKTKIGDEIIAQENTDSEGKITINEISTLEYIAYASDSEYTSEELSFTVLPGQLNTVILNAEKIEHYAVSFNKNGYLTASELPPYGATYTISGMIKPTGDGVRTISGFGTLDGFSSFFRLEGDNHLYLGQWSGSFKKARSNEPLVMDDWSHFALVVNNHEVSFYINGVDVGATFTSGAAPMDNPITPDTFKFGAMLQSGYNFNESFIGSLNKLAFWSSAREADDIAAESISGLTGSEPGLWGYWNFDDNTTTTTDLSGNSHTLELGGDATLYIVD